MSISEPYQGPPPVRSIDSPARGKLTDRAYEHVRIGILQGRFPVGSVVAEGTIATELAISKTPVRQALQMLSREGLLEIGKRRQLVVRGFRPEHRAEVLEIREALEEIAVHHACERMSEDKIDYLRLLVMRQGRAVDADDDDRFVDLDEEFHLRIAEGADLPIIAKILGQLRGFVRIMRLGSAQVRDARTAVEEHGRIVDAIEARDPVLAVAALQMHLRNSSRFGVEADTTP